MEYLKYFFNPDHLLSLRPPVMSSRAAIILIIGYGLLIALGIFYHLKAKRTNDGLKKKGYKQFNNLFLTIGILGWVYTFFATQGVVMLSSRIIIIILDLILIIWGGFIVKYLLVTVPAKRKKINQTNEMKKYIP